MVVTLEETKLYLRVDGDEENTLITKFILTAEELCEDILIYKLTELEIIHKSVMQTILYAVANTISFSENVSKMEVRVNEVWI